MATIKKYDEAWFGRVKDLEDREDLALVNRDIEMKDLYEYLGRPRWFKDFSGCFVKVGEGEYEEIYCYKGGPVAHYDQDVYKIIKVGKPDVGDKVKLRPDVLVRHARRIPPRAGYTREQFRDGTVIGLDYHDLELLD